MLFFPFVFALVMFAFGISALRLNPRRPANQILAAVCFISALMFLAQLAARYQGAQYAIDQISNPMPWVRVRFACIGLLCPMMVWLCYYVVSGRYTDRANLVRKMIPWIAISAALVVVAFSETFKSSDSRPDRILNGPLYPVYFAVMFSCQLALCVASIVVERRLSGIRRLEFRFITIPFGYLSLAALFAALLDLLFAGRHPAVLDAARALSTLAFPVFGICAWSVTSRRIYHGSQVLLPLAQNLGLVGSIALVAAFALTLLPRAEMGLYSIATVIALACALAMTLHQRLNGSPFRRSEAHGNAVVRDLHAISRAGLDPDDFLGRCESLLATFVSGSRVQILQLQDDRYERGTLAFATQSLAGTPLHSEGSASVVALARLHSRSNSSVLRARMEAERIHLIVSSHWSENQPSVIIAFGERENGLPFTHPEIEILGRLAEIIDSLYTKARFSLQARQAEQLATIGLVGAGIAHELRNPMEAIDTFAQLLPTRLNDHQFLHDFAEVIPGEAKRIQALAGQLLDLSRPRTYTFLPVDIHAVIADSLALLRTQASAANVDIVFDSHPGVPTVLADAQALRQVCLNLLMNSIRSISHAKRPGRITVRVTKMVDAILLDVEDDGPGIPSSVMGSLFRPFVSADKKGGLGLGLAICAEIARVHRGGITADNLPDGGARFRVHLPVTPDAIAPNPNRGDRKDGPTSKSRIDFSNSKAITS